VRGQGIAKETRMQVLRPQNWWGEYRAKDEADTGSGWRRLFTKQRGKCCSAQQRKMSRVTGPILGAALAVGSADAKTCGLWIDKEKFVPYSTCDYEHHPKARHENRPHRPPRQPKHIHHHQAHEPTYDYEHHSKARHEHRPHRPPPRQPKHIHHHKAHESIPAPKPRPDTLYEKMYRALHSPHP
jgi:hypothetical protein